MTTGGSREKIKIIKVGITFSTFDLFHAGHVKMLEEDKNANFVLYFNAKPLVI